MRQRKIIGVIFCIIGIVLILAGRYVQSEIAQGRGQIHQAEQASTAAKGILSSQNSHVQKYGNKALGYVEDRVDEGTLQANFYEKVSYALFALGVIAIIVGIYLIFKRA